LRLEDIVSFEMSSSSVRQRDERIAEYAAVVEQVRGPLISPSLPHARSPPLQCVHLFTTTRPICR
jgi:hypothetical protein